MGKLRLVVDQTHSIYLGQDAEFGPPKPHRAKPLGLEVAYAPVGVWQALRSCCRESQVTFWKMEDTLSAGFWKLHISYRSCNLVRKWRLFSCRFSTISSIALTAVQMICLRQVLCWEICMPSTSPRQYQLVIRSIVDLTRVAPKTIHRECCYNFAHNEAQIQRARTGVMSGLEKPRQIYQGMNSSQIFAKCNKKTLYLWSNPPQKALCSRPELSPM